MIVLDTNVVSETVRVSPSPQVLHWLASQPRDSVFITAITEAEIHYGIGLLPRGKRRTALQRTIDGIFEEVFAGRILAFDSAAARVFSEIAVTRRSIGQPISQADAQIAAISRSHGAAIATRNEEDFAECGITVINPWKAGHVPR